MSETQTQQQPTTQEEVKEVAKEVVKEVVKQHPKRPTGYRVEESKTIEINRSHTDRRERAQVLKTITIGLFGRKRFRNIYLVSSLNNFYYALMIANTLQKRVEKLALVIGMEKVKYTEFAEEGAQGVEKDYSTFSIKITRQPTEDDKNHSGFNEGIQKIENPLTEIMKLGGQKRRNDRRNLGKRNYPQRREDGGRRRENVHHRREFEEKRRSDRGTSDRRPQQQQQQAQGKPHHEREEKQFDRRRRPQTQYIEKAVEVKRQGVERPRKRDYDQDRRQQPQQNINKKEKPEKTEEEDKGRGEKRTRGTYQRPQGRVADHEYKREHMNRGPEDREDRRERAPKRSNRYSSDDEY